MAGYNANVWKEIELRVDPDPFCTPRQISSIKKKLDPKIHLNKRHLSNGVYEYYSSNSIKTF